MSDIDDVTDVTAEFGQMTREYRHGDRKVSGKHNRETLRRMRYDDGKTLKQIAVHFGCSEGSVSIALSKLPHHVANPDERRGKSPKPAPSNKVLHPHVIAYMHKTEGKTLPEIAEELTASLNSVTAAFNRAGHKVSVRAPKPSPSAETVEIRAAKLRGVPRKEEHKAKMRKPRQQPMSDTHRANLAIAHTGLVQDAAHIEARIAPLRGKTRPVAVGQALAEGKASVEPDVVRAIRQETRPFTRCGHLYPVKRGMFYAIKARISYFHVPDT